MKPRTVIVTLEMQTNAPLKTLRNLNSWFLRLEEGESFEIMQKPKVSVAQPPKPKKG